MLALSKRRSEVNLQNHCRQGRRDGKKAHPRVGKKLVTFWLQDDDVATGLFLHYQDAGGEETKGRGDEKNKRLEDYSCSIVRILAEQRKINRGGTEVNRKERHVGKS